MSEMELREKEDNLAGRLETTLNQMAASCSVDMNLWNDHSNAVLEAISALSRTSKEAVVLDALAAHRVVFERVFDLLGGIREDARSRCSPDAPGCVNRILGLADEARKLMAKDTLNALDVALKTEAVQDGWQPIQSAPKDGTEILGWFPCLKLNEDGDLTDELVDEEPFGGRAIVAWEGGCWSEPDWLSASGDFFGDDFEYAPDPTLWQPLPPPPQLVETNGERDA